MTGASGDAHRELQPIKPFQKRGGKCRTCRFVRGLARTTGFQAEGTLCPSTHSLFPRSKGRFCYLPFVSVDSRAYGCSIVTSLPSSSRLPLNLAVGSAP